MKDYSMIINNKSVELQLYGERIREIVGDIGEYLSQDIKTDEDARLFCCYSEGMNNRVDIIFDYIRRMEQLGKIIECLSGKLLSDNKTCQVQY